MSNVLRHVVVVLAILTASSAARADFNDQARTMSNIFTYSNNITTASVAYSAQQSQYRAYTAGTNAITAQHATVDATDFRPARAGHPVIDQDLATADTTTGTCVRAIVANFDGRLRRNNLATAASLAFETATYVLDHRTLTGDQEAQLFSVVNDTLAAAPGLARASAADKQQMADTLLLATALMFQYEQANNHDTSVAIAKQMMTVFGIAR